uniref:Uncharacterized protein n=1 Tax=uncultured Armatimonadetes bacterium TaxID=157466 RepID=A0A6J4K601_9BACT|nr:hypothetical protein AVDCRST_MAG63-4874 [uncultured Armatimonadetes bacterium]
MDDIFLAFVRDHQLHHAAAADPAARRDAV